MFVNIEISNPDKISAGCLSKEDGFLYASFGKFSAMENSF
jgi:hypothetical protein